MKKLLIFCSLVTLLVALICNLQSVKLSTVVETQPAIDENTTKKLPRSVEVPAKPSVSETISVAVVDTKEEKAAAHIEVDAFLQSAEKDIYAYQQIAKAVISNKMNLGYLSPLYFDAKALTRIKYKPENPKYSNETIYNVWLKRVKMRYTGKGELGLPALTSEQLSVLDQILAIEAPTSALEGSKPVARLLRISTPQDQWLTAQDILKYIQEHPAAPPTAQAATVQAPGPILPAPQAAN